MPDAFPKRRGGAVALAVGCLAAPLLVAVIFVALKWNALQGFAKLGVAGFNRLQVARAAVQRQTGTPHVWITHQLDSSTAGRALTIKVVNSPVLGLDDPRLRDSAAAVASVAHGALPPEHRYHRYHVVIVQQVGSALSLQRDRRFHFEAGELPAATDLALPSPGSTAPGPWVDIDNAALASPPDLEEAHRLLQQPPAGCRPGNLASSGRSATASTGGEITVMLRCGDGVRFYSIHHGKTTRLQ
jgi:hypothetical protein